MDNEYKELYESIKQGISKNEEIYISTLQRKFNIGYPLATRMLQRLIDQDIIEPTPDDYKFIVK